MNTENQGSVFKSILVPVAIALAFLIWGLMVFYFVGDKTVDQWDFGALPDVPGQSIYSTEGVEYEPGPEREGRGAGILRQHVDSNPNEPQKPIREGTPDETPQTP